MQIQILGAGNMATALGGHWMRAGHDVTTSDRARPAAIGPDCDAVLLAVPAGAVANVVAGLDLRGKVLIDCTNAVVDAELTTSAMAESVAELTGARVVKAFNLCPDDIWRMTPPPVTVPLCGDDPAALAVVRGLVRDIGCEPVDGGGLGRARLFEATAAVVIGLAMGGGSLRAAIDM